MLTRGLNVEADAVCMDMTDEGRAARRPYDDGEIERGARRCPGCGRKTVQPCVACVAERAWCTTRNLELLGLVRPRGADDDDDVRERGDE